MWRRQLKGWQGGFVRGIAAVAAGAMAATTCAFAEVVPSVCTASGCAGDIVVGIQAAFVPSWLPAVDQAGRLAGFVEHPTTNLEIAIGIENPTDQPLRLERNPIAQVQLNQPKTPSEEARILAGTISALEQYAIDSPALPLEIPPHSSITIDTRTIRMAGPPPQGGGGLLIQATVLRDAARVLGSALERIALPESLPPLELSAAASAPALNQSTLSIAQTTAAQSNVAGSAVGLSQSGSTAAPVSPGDPSNEGGVPGGATGPGAGATNGNGSTGFSISMNGRNGNVTVSAFGNSHTFNGPLAIALAVVAAVAPPALALAAFALSIVTMVINIVNTVKAMFGRSPDPTPHGNTNNQTPAPNAIDLNDALSGPPSAPAPNAIDLNDALSGPPPAPTDQGVPAPAPSDAPASPDDGTTCGVSSSPDSGSTSTGAVGEASSDGEE